MNTPFLLAQASPQAPTLLPPRVIQLTKPPGNQSVTVQLDGATRIDFSQIASETVTLVRIGEKLIVLFDNQTTVTLGPVFGAEGQPRPDVTFVLPGDRIVTGAEFATLFPITTDQSVLPAADAAGGPASGASFHDHGPVDPLGEGRQALDLLGAETHGAAAFGAAPPPLPSDGTLPIIGTPDARTVDDGALGGGNLDGGESPGDVPGASASVTGSLNVNFNGDAVGRSFAFSAAQPGLEGLFSGGAPVTIAIGRSAIIGHTGNPSDPVFVITLDASSLEGAYTFTLFRALDHAIQGAEDSLLLPIAFIAIDGNGDTAAGTFVVTVNDDSPRVNGIATSMGENDTASIDLGNDVSFGADHAAAMPITLSFTGLTGIPANVSLGLPPIRFAGSTLEIAPGSALDALSLGEAVQLHFTYAATDGDGDTVADDIVVTVNGANDAPVSGFGSAVGLFEQRNTTGSPQVDTISTGFTFTDVDLNDVGHTASVTGVTSSGNTAGLPGAASLLSFLTIDSVAKAAGSSAGLVGWTFSAPDRTFDYLEEGETVTFTYTVTVDDGDGGTLAETVTVFVTGSNDAPQPQDDTVTAIEDTPLVVSAANGVLANDIDVDGDALSVVTGPAGGFSTTQGGIIQFNADGSYIYTPPPNYSGPDSVTYVVRDVHGATATATLNITVSDQNDAPAISGLQDATVAEGQVGALIDTFTVSDVDTAGGLSFRVLDGIGNVDPRFTVVAVGGTTFGQPGSYELRLAPGQSLNFTAENADGNPTITRTVEVNDQAGTNNISTASLTMTVEDANAAPSVTSATSSGTIVEDQSFGTPPQLINNGGFESWTYNSQSGTYTIPDWTFAGNFYYPPGIVGIAHSGGAALGAYTFNSGSGGTASETFATVAGQHYHVRFFLEKEHAGSGNAISASWNGETLVAIANQTSFGNYAQYNFDVVGGDGASTLRFNFVSGVASYWFLDDVSAAPVYTPGVELRSGRIGFADADLTDSHTVTVTPDSGGYVGNFTWTLTDSTGTGAGRINWDFNVNDADIQWLGPSSTLTQTYHLVINDGHGGSVAQDVTVTFSGVNDAPTGNLIIDGVPTVNQILTATNTIADAEGLGTLHYQWQRSDGAGWINVGSDQVTYALVADDIGHTTRVVVSYADGGGTSETVASGPTAVIGNINSAPIVTSVTDNPVGLDVAVNGGFETGNLTGWTQSGDTGFTSVITSNVHSGTYDLRAGPSSSGFITQTFATAVDQSYLVSFWVRSDSGAPPAAFTASWNGGTLLSLTNTAGQPYTEYTFEVSATSASANLTFSFSNGSSWWYLDDVTLRAAGQAQSGQVTFIDANPADTHTASFVPTGPGYVGVFTVSANATESGGNGFVNWQFTLTDAEAQALSAGPHTQTYSVIIDDGHGGFVTQDVTVTFQGHTTPPAGADHTVTMVEDVSYTFAAADFGFSDADGGQFAGVVITTLPGSAAGQLLCRNTAVTAGQFITAADIAAGMLIYAPADNALGDTSFTFQVRDDAPGGAALRTDQSPNTMTIDMDGTNYQDLANTQSGNTTTYPDATGFALTAASPNDHVSVRDNSGNSDTILVNTASGTTFTDLTFARADNNLEIGWAVASGSRTVTILDAYNAANRVENFRLDEGGSYAGVSLGSSNYTLVSGLTGSNSTNDLIAGSGASETLSGQGGSDLLFGNGGNDTLRGGTGLNVLDGGAGIDLLDFSDASSGIDFALIQSNSFTTATLGASYGGAFTVDAYRNIEGVIGSNSADTLTGSTFGDVINGGGGADILTGGDGSDQLTGGAAADIFRYLAGDTANGANDDILDFATGASGDVIDLSDLLSSVTPADRETHVRFQYGDGSTRLLSTDLSPPPTRDGDVTIQVILGGSSWSNVAVIHDTGANLTAGSEVIRMMLDATQTQYHV